MTTIILDDAAKARAWIEALPGVSRETMERLELFGELLGKANLTQNLVAASTLQDDMLWTRHFADSAQLIPLVPPRPEDVRGTWVDLGSGPGLPGLVVAILAPEWDMTLVESRRLRCDFLRECVDALELGDRVSVEQNTVERFSPGAFDVISARAFAPLQRLIVVSRHLAAKNSIWLLPKGKNAQTELSTLSPTWQTACVLQPSLTDENARIIVAHGAFPDKASKNSRRSAARA